MWRICSFRRGKWEKTAEETTSFPDIKGLERKVPWDGREANSRTEKKRTHIAVTAILSSPSGLADAREQLKAMTRKAQHTPETLDSLGMIISPLPLPGLFLPSVLWRQCRQPIERRRNHRSRDRPDDDCAEKSPPTAFLSNAATAPKQGRGGKRDDARLRDRDRG